MSDQTGSIAIPEEVLMNKIYLIQAQKVMLFVLWKLHLLLFLQMKRSCGWYFFASGMKSWVETCLGADTESALVAAPFHQS
jgi:hypothetical protein